MSNDEKFCPLCNMICKGEECGLWSQDRCSFVSLAQSAAYGARDIYWILRELRAQ